MKNRVLYFILIFIFAIFLLGGTAYGGEQKLKNLHYDAFLNEDGSANITENWEIKVSDTNTLLKDFSKTIKGITNVKVSEITEDGREIPFINSGRYQYHVDRGHYYGLIQSGKFEIAWGVSIEGTQIKKYKISYNISNAVKTYQDCSEFYWQFIGNTNSVPASKVTGTIKLPKSVENKDSLRAWAHGPLNGNINIIDNQTVAFEVKDLNASTMVEVRIVSLEDSFVLNENKVGTSKLENILSEEQKWADEANAIRKAKNTIFAVLGTIFLGIALLFIFKIVKYIKILSNTKKTEPKQKLDYFRDFPDNNATPAEAAFLYYFDKDSAFDSNISKIVSATILNLALKGAVSFEQGKKDEVYIIINENKNLTSLKEDESSILELLIGVKSYLIQKNNKEIAEKISMKDIEKYAKVHDETFLSKINGIKAKVQKQQQENGNYDKALLEKSKTWRIKYSSYFVVTMVFLFSFYFVAPIIIAIPCAICAILCNKIYKKMRTLTQKGTNEQEQWKALKKYMEDFSLLNEREVPELILWEKYLVYATAFGIADKVLEQLKVKYPEFRDQSFMINNGYTYMYMLNRINMDTMLVSGMSKAYSAGQIESAGGNYSSGFGRRRRLLWWSVVAGGGRRPEWAEDK